MNGQANPQQILAEMLQKGTLRALDKNVLDVCAITENTDTSFADLAEVIMRDAGLSTSLLAMANSAGYAAVEPVRTISAAVIRLGFQRIHALALGLAIFKQAGQNARTPDLYRMYAATYLAGSFAMELLRRKGYEGAEEGFVAGLLIQVPRLVLANTFPQKYKEAERLMASEDLLFGEACRRVFGMEYTVLHRAVLQHWRVLASVAAAALTADSGSGAGNRARLVHEASHLADMLFGNTRGGEAVVAQSEKLIAELLGDVTFSASQFVQTVSQKDENIQRFFKLSPKDLEMMFRIAQWGRVNTAQIAASLTLGSAQEELDEGGESPEQAIGNYLTELICLSRRGADINHLLLLAQEASFRCLRPTHIVTALLDTTQTLLRGRFHAGAQGKLPPSILNVPMTRADSPIVRCMMGRVPQRADASAPGWELSLLKEMPFRFALMVPIVAHDRALGMQFLARSEEPAFSKQETTWCEAIVGCLGYAFERPR